METNTDSMSAASSRPDSLSLPSPSTSRSTANILPPLTSASASGHGAGGGGDISDSSDNSLLAACASTSSAFTANISRQAVNRELTIESACFGLSASASLPTSPVQNSHHHNSLFDSWRGHRGGQKTSSRFEPYQSMGRSVTPGPELLRDALDTVSSCADLPQTPRTRPRQNSGPMTIPSRRLHDLRRESSASFCVQSEVQGEKMLKVGTAMHRGFNDLAVGDADAFGQQERKRTQSLCEPISVLTSCFVPVPCSPSPTRPNDYHKQCYSPSTQKIVRNNLPFSPSPSPTPSPTRKNSLLRSISPIAVRGYLPGAGSNQGVLLAMGGKRRYNDAFSAPSSVNGGDLSPCTTPSLRSNSPGVPPIQTPPPLLLSGLSAPSPSHHPLSGHGQTVMSSLNYFGPTSSKRFAPGSRSPLVESTFALADRPQDYIAQHILKKTLSSSSFGSDQASVTELDSVSADIVLGPSTDKFESSAAHMTGSGTGTDALLNSSFNSTSSLSRPSSVGALPGTPNSTCSAASTSMPSACLARAASASASNTSSLIDSPVPSDQSALSTAANHNQAETAIEKLSNTAIDNTDIEMAGD